MKNRNIILVVFGILIALPAVNVSAEEDRYVMCKRIAKQETGYYGPVPKEHIKTGGFLRGAAKGAATGAAIGWISGKKNKKLGKSAKRGAGIGGLIGLLKQAGSNSKAKKRNRENDMRREAYYIELNACMSAGN